MMTKVKILFFVCLLIGSFVGAASAPFPVAQVARYAVSDLSSGDIIDAASKQWHIREQALDFTHKRKRYPRFLMHVPRGRLEGTTWCLVRVNGKDLKQDGKIGLFRNGFDGIGSVQSDNHILITFYQQKDVKRKPKSQQGKKFLIEKTKEGWLRQLKTLGYKQPTDTTHQDVLTGVLEQRLGDAEDVVIAYLLLKKILKTQSSGGLAGSSMKAVTIDIVGSQDSCYACMWLFLKLVSLYKGKLIIRYSSLKSCRTERLLRQVCCEKYPSVAVTTHKVSMLPTDNPKTFIPTRDPKNNGRLFLFVYSCPGVVSGGAGPPSPGGGAEPAHAKPPSAGPDE